MLAKLDDVAMSEQRDADRSSVDPEAVVSSGFYRKRAAFTSEDCHRPVRCPCRSVVAYVNALRPIKVQGKQGPGEPGNRTTRRAGDVLKRSDDIRRSGMMGFDQGHEVPLLKGFRASSRS